MQIASQITNIFDATKDDWALDPDGAIGAACLALFPADTHTGAGGNKNSFRPSCRLLSGVGEVNRRKDLSEQVEKWERS